MKRIVVLATGGTISGHSPNPLEYVDYGAGIYHVKEMLEQIPELDSQVKITFEQLENFNSCEMTAYHWSLLKQRIEFFLNEQEYDGVVITHGTNTMEETSYFLNLTVNTTKPVVLVGSQRPLSAIGTDAIVNLYNAIKVAMDDHSYEKGVLVVLNNQINSGRDVTKTSTYFVETFQSGHMGFLGYIDADGSVQFYRNTTKKHTSNSIFSKLNITELPEVAIVYSHAGASGDIINFISETKKYKGIVIAGSGAGMISRAEEKALRDAKDQGITVVRSSRTGNGRVLPIKQYKEHEFVAADNLNAQKSRILLMLSLKVTDITHEIQSFFNHY